MIPVVAILAAGEDGALAAVINAVKDENGTLYVATLGPRSDALLLPITGGVCCCD